MTCNGGEPKRRERKQSAKTSRSSSSSTSSCSPNPSRASPATSLLPLQVPPDLGQPPRYSTLFPAQTAILPPRPRRPSHPSSIGIATNQAPPPPLPSWIYGSQNASSSLASLRPIARPGDQFDHAHDDWQEASPEAVKHEALCGIISSKLDALITSIDSESFGGDEKELEIHDGPSSGTRGGWGSTGQQVSQSANRAISSAFLGTNYFAKVNLYANAKLPLNLPPLHL